MALLEESTDELESHMRRFLIGNWDTHIELDEERGEREMGVEEWTRFKGFFAGFAGGFSSQIEFKEDGTTVGTTAAPPGLEGFVGDELRDRKWELVKQNGKQTTVLLTGRGLGGIKHTRELILTVLDADTLQMEDSDLKDKPFKPITFKRLK